jgi:hypothetical protein
VAVTTGSGTAGDEFSRVIRVSSSNQPSSSVRVVMSRSLSERRYGSVVGRSVRGSAALG